MYDVTAIGEALIDFIPAQRDCALKEVESFTRVCGGAPTNLSETQCRLALTAGTDSADLAGGNRYPALLLGFSGRIPDERNP